VPDFLYIFGYETPRQRRNNSAHGWDDEDSRCVLIAANEAPVAQAWGDRIAQRYCALLHQEPEVDWNTAGYAGFIEVRRDLDISCCPRVRVGEYPDFTPWLDQDRDL
jgi:hypothetical protein